MLDKINTKKSEFLFNMLLITIFWNIWFPKAGIKIGGIPFTLGNVVFAITFILWVGQKIKKGKISKIPLAGMIFIGIFYFFLKYLYLFLIKNIALNSIIGYIIPLCIYPLIFLVTYDLIDNKAKLDKILKVIIWGFFFLCIYAILQYIFKIETVAIPGLTVNLTDYQEFGPLWYMTKANGTDINSAKIVGTYQNGNLFGISLLLIYPIVFYFYRYTNQIKKQIISLVLFILTVFLTLSRSCWLGIILFIFLGVLMDKDKTKKSILLKFIILILFILSIIAVFELFPVVAERFFGTSNWLSMSGRTDGLIEVFNSLKYSNNILAYLIGPYGIAPFSGLAYEMLPLSVFVQTGLIGVVLLYLVFFSFFKLIKSNNYIPKAISLAIIIWLIVSLIEGGYWLPPAALNIFMIMALGLKTKKLLIQEEKVYEISNCYKRFSTSTSV